MVSSAELPPRVRQFIHAHIGTLEQLELLLLLMQTPERWWDASAIADHFGLSVEAARRALDHFAARNLLAIRITGDVRYQYQPGEADLAEAARLFAEAFRVNRLAILKMVARPERQSIRDFAEAFRIRRDDNS